MGQAANNICDDLKIFTKAGIGIIGTNFTRTEFQECKSLTVQMYD
ncbi:hypothetical protein [Silvanigrella sp.]|jgi:hypothetical protein